MRGIQLSYNTVNDIISDKSLTKGMVVYAASLFKLGDCGGSYYEITDLTDLSDSDVEASYKMNNGFYAKPLETTPYKEKLENINELISDAESTLDVIKDLINVVEGLEENISKEVQSEFNGISDDLNTKIIETNSNLSTVDNELDNVSEVVGELCDECLTLYSKALQLKGTSMGDMSLINLVPILDSDIDNLAMHIGFHEDSLDILAKQIGFLIDYDYRVKNRIKDLENAVKSLKPDFNPDPYPNSGKDNETDNIKDPDNETPIDGDNPVDDDI